MTDDLELYLTTCQIWISGTSIALGIVAEPGLAALFEPLFRDTFLASVGAGSFLGFFLINMVHLTHGEQTPTYLGVERSKQVARYGAGPLYWFAWVISPLIRFGDWVAKGTLKLFGIEMTGAWLETEEEVIETRAQLHGRLHDVLERGELSEERHEEVLGALAAGTQRVDRVMVDAEDIVYLSTDASVEENLRRLSESPHTRYPLVGSEPAEFRGIVYVPSVLDEISALERGETTFEDIAAPPMRLAPDVTVSDAIDQFQDEHQELALVFSDGEVVGLFTATDAFETVMGELEDPLDEAESNGETV